MPVVQESFEFRNFGARSNETHDWDTLLDGKIYKCVEGVDFRVKKLTFLNAARAEAKNRGLKLRTGSGAKGENAVIIQAQPGDTPDATEGANGTAPAASEPPKPVPPPSAKPAVTTAPVAKGPAPKPAAKK